MPESKFELLYADLGKAIIALNASLEINLKLYDSNVIDTLKNGQIQKFEYNMELLWKTLKAYFFEGRGISLKYSKEIIKYYFEEQIIDENTFLILIDALDSRNALSHVYKEEVFLEIYPKIKMYAAAIETTYLTLKLRAI